MKSVLCRPVAALNMSPHASSIVQTIFLISKLKKNVAIDNHVYLNVLFRLRVVYLYL